MSDIALYSNLLSEIKARLRQAQSKAVLSVNAEMITMYFDIGKLISQKQKLEGWGAGVIPRLSKDIRNELPEVKGFSERNIGRMIAFYLAYGSEDAILPQAVAKLGEDVFLGIPWGNYILLLEKDKI